MVNRTHPLWLPKEQIVGISHSTKIVEMGFTFGAPMYVPFTRFGTMSTQDRRGRGLWSIKKIIELKGRKGGRENRGT